MPSTVRQNMSSWRDFLKLSLLLDLGVEFCGEYGTRARTRVLQTSTASPSQSYLGGS